MALWHYVVGQDRLGPVTDDDIGKLIRSGDLNRDTLVWNPSFDGWKSAGEALASLFDVPPPVPAPPSVPSSVRLSKGEPDTASRTSDTSPPTRVRTGSWSSLEAAGPWPRFWARAIDIWLLAPLIAFAIGIFTAIYSSTVYVELMAMNSTVLGIALLPLVGIVLALLMAVIGTTPGKAVLGIRVTSIADGNKFLFYLIRELKVWVFGLGFGIPIVALVTQIYQCRRVGAGNAAGYDEGFAMVEGKPSMTRVVAAAVCAVALLSVSLVLASLDDTAQREIHTTRSWENPVTGRRAEIAQTWTEEDTKADSGSLFYFVSSTLSAEALLGHEEIGFDGFAAEDYGEALGKALEPGLKLTSGWVPTTINGQRTLRATAKVDEYPETGVEVLIRVSGRNAWRVLVFAAGRSTNELPGREQLVNALFSTVE